MARYLVTNETFKDHLTDINEVFFLALDTETTGLNYYLGARTFSAIISTSEHDYYFNFDDTPDHLGKLAPAEYILPKAWLAELCTVFHDPNKTVFLENAKFDMHMVAASTKAFTCTIFCTEAMARLVHNQLPSYSLANLGKLIGHEKDDTVEKYISKHKLYTEIEVGKKKPRKDKHYDQVPFEIISEYGLTDGRVTYELGMYIKKRLSEMDTQHIEEGLPSMKSLISNEAALTKVLFKMEQRGILIDLEYCKEAYEHYWDQYLEACEKFYVYTGVSFQDAAECFKEVWQKMGFTPGKTPKGNDSYSAENLPDSPVSPLILECRQNYKKSTTYFKNYMDMVDPDGVVHCNFRQGGTKTGRLSSFDPNLQNVPKRGEDDSAFPVRKCFIPRPGYFLAMIDWDQMEYRMLLDRAGEAGVISKIKDEGLDVHTATAVSMNVEREPAKTLNFMLLYGGGAAKLAAALKVALKTAKDYKAKYFRTLRKVQALVKALEATAKRRGYITNWFGRRLLLDSAAPYRMPNHYIQGGCGDVCRVAMVEMDKYLEDKKIFMLLQVHDELIFEVKYGEEHHLKGLKDIMENTYPHIDLPLTAGVEYSETDWFNKKEFKDEMVMA